MNNATWNDLDVLYERGRACHHHIGTTSFRNMVRALKPLYYPFPRNSIQNEAIVAFIINAIHARGGRFLHRSTGDFNWTIIIDAVAIRAKVMRTLTTIGPAEDGDPAAAEVVAAFRNQQANPVPPLVQLDNPLPPIYPVPQVENPDNVRQRDGDGDNPDVVGHGDGYGDHLQETHNFEEGEILEIFSEGVQDERFRPGTASTARVVDFFDIPLLGIQLVGDDTMVFPEEDSIELDEDEIARLMDD